MDTKIVSFTDLRVWQEAHVLSLEIYKISKLFPDDEKYGLVSQIRRAVLSITSNIAEGFGRRTGRDRSHFYILALGSGYEVQNQLLLARDLGYLEKQKFDRLAEKSIVVVKMLNALISKTRL